MRKAAEVVPVSAIMTTKSNNLGAKPRVSRVGAGRRRSRISAVDDA